MVRVGGGSMGCNGGPSGRVAHPQLPGWFLGVAPRSPPWAVVTDGSVSAACAGGFGGHEPDSTKDSLCLPQPQPSPEKAGPARRFLWAEWSPLLTGPAWGAGGRGGGGPSGEGSALHPAASPCPAGAVQQFTGWGGVGCPEGRGADCPCLEAPGAARALAGMRGR